MMKRFRWWRILLLLLVLRTVVVAGEENAEAERGYQVFGKEHLATDQGWQLSDTKFTPATANHDASVEFTPNKWSALISTLPLERLEGAFVFHLRSRWTVPPVAGHDGNAVLMFLDSEGAVIPGEKNKFFPNKADWQDLMIENQVPKGAATVRLDVISNAGGTLEIAGYDLFLNGVDLSTAAIRGVHMPWLRVGGSESDKPRASAEGASAVFTSSAPYSFDSAIWNTLPAYPILTTSKNKTPPNDVAASFQLAWTADTIFVRFRAHDRTLNFADPSLYMRDCFEFFLLPIGHAPEASAGIVPQEQYTITRSKDGRTEGSTDAITRVTDDGWEAIAKIPLRSDARRISPFNGLTMTCNAAYQDANTMGQEHWLSFSRKDQTNASWNTPAVYVPLVFETGQTLAYQPLDLGSSTAYHVDPKFPGRINLVHAAASMENVVPWIEPPDSLIEAQPENGHDVFRVKYPDYSPQIAMTFSMSPFNVLAGETLNVEMEGRIDSGTIRAPGLIFLAQSNWQQVSSEVSPGTMGKDWTKLIYTLKVPDRFHDNLRNVRPLFTLETAPGRTVELRDIRVTRRLPADFDALISLDSLYSHFWAGEKSTLRFHLASGTGTKTKIKAEVQDYFSGKTVLAQEWTQDLPAGEGDLTWDVSALPNGFYNVLLKARDDKGGFLADRELYVSKGVKAPKTSAFSGIWMGNNYGLTAPQDLPKALATLRDLGIGMVQWQDFFLFDSRGKEMTWDALKALRAFHAAGFETGMTVEQSGTHKINRLWQPDELEDFYQKFCTKTRGLFSHLSFSNEPNLTMGWFPVPDAREWAVYNRGFYNAVKKYAPGTTPICGSFNGVPVKYIQDAAAVNRNSFADGVVGLHAYGVDGGQNPFKNLLEERQQIEQVHPGWDVWDTESGMVNYTFRNILEAQSKKAPQLQSCGITRSYFYQDPDLIFPCGDSNPLIAMEGFKNTFYLDTKPVGHVGPSAGQAEIYLFKDAAGRGLAVYWNRSHDDLTLDLPGIGGGELFDVFGNHTGTLAQGVQRLVLKDRFVHYARGVDLMALTKDASFVPSFQHTQTKPATDPGFSTAVYLSLPYIIRAFDRELAVGQPSGFAISVHNAGATPQKVTLGSQGPEGLQIGFDKDNVVLLQPGESQVVPVKLLARKTLPQQSFTLTGALGDGTQALPLIFTVRTTPPTDVNGYTRLVELRNNSNAAADVTVTPAKPEFFFTPSTIKQRLEPSATVAVPLQITHKETAESTLNTPVYYDLNMTSSAGDYTKPGISTVFAADGVSDAAANFANLPYTAVPRQPGQEKFQAEYKLGWMRGDLRITARVQDSSPVQIHDGAQLKNGGDCMIVAFDADKAQPPGTFGAGYFECGFALSGQTPTSYVWDGRYGLETATPFLEAVRHISRDANFIYYDVMIPGTRIFPDKNAASAGMSIAFVNRTADGKSELIELGQGIFPERNAGHLGLLLRPK